MQTALRDVKCRVEVYPVRVHQLPDQLGPRDGGMGIVHLDRDLGRQRAQITIMRQETAHQILQGSGGEKELLLEAQFLADLGAVVGIQHARDRFRQHFRRGSLHEFATVERIKIK